MRQNGCEFAILHRSSYFIVVLRTNRNFSFPWNGRKGKIIIDLCIMRYAKVYAAALRRFLHIVNKCGPRRAILRFELSFDSRQSRL